MSHRKRSLSPAQLRYFKIGPKVLDPEDLETKRKLDEALDCRIDLGDSYRRQPSLITLHKLSKTTYGNFQGTVRNFSILLNRNLGLDSIPHQIQKFGQRVRVLSNTMIADRKNGDRATSRQKALRDKITAVSDGRRFLEAQSHKSGMDLKLKLKSFQLRGISSSTFEMLPVPYLKLLVQNVSTFRLVGVIESSLKLDGNQMTVEFQKIASKASVLNNREQRYQQTEFVFQRLGQQLKLTVPLLVISTDQGTSMSTIIDNCDILSILQTDFQNCDQMADKYFGVSQLEPSDINV